MAEKEPTAEQPYRAGDTIATPWAEARERRYLAERGEAMAGEEIELDELHRLPDG